MNDLRVKKGKKTKKVIIETAIEILYEEGLSGLTARNLSEKSGVSKGNLYHHFKNMDDIFEEAFKEAIKESYEDIMNYEYNSIYEFLLQLGVNSIDKASCQREKVSNNIMIFWNLVFKNQRLKEIIIEFDLFFKEWIVQKIEAFLDCKLPEDVADYVVNITVTFISGTKSYIFLMGDEFSKYKEAWKNLAKHLEEKILEEIK